MNCIYPKKINLEPTSYKLGKTPDPGGKISADGTLKPSFSFSLNQKSAVEFGTDMKGTITWNNNIPNMFFSIEECKVNNEIYLIKGSCPSSVLKVKTSWT